MRPSFGRQVVFPAQIRIGSTGNVLKLLLLAQIRITLLLSGLVDINMLMYSTS